MSWWRRKSWEHDLDSELQSHLELEAAEQRQHGLDPAAARQAAQRAFGNTVLVLEATRSAWGWNSLERFWQDLRYAARTMRRSPVVTTVAVLSLALGIGANTAIFSLFDAVLLKSLPVREPGSLYYLKGGSVELPYPDYIRLRDRTRTLEGVVASGSGTERAELSIGNGAPETADVQLVSGNYFSVLGVGASAGRVLDNDDDVGLGAHPVAVLSHGFWTRRLAADPNAVGRSIRLNGLPFTIVGVAPPEFFGTSVGHSPDIWTPLSMQAAIAPGLGTLDSPFTWWLNVIGRLRPDATREQAAAEIGILWTRIDAELRPGGGKGPARAAMQLLPASKGLDELRDQFSKPLQVLMIVVALVLLIACVNLANLLLSRAAGRQPELALRLAIGAGRSRLVSQLLTESLLLSVAGGLCGLVFAQWGSALVLRMASGDATPIPVHITADLRTLGFTLLLSIATGLFFGAAPAFRAARLDPGPAMKKAASGLTASSPAGRALVALQVGLSLVLLIGAGLFVRSLATLRGVDTGFNREHLLLLRLASQNSYKGAARQSLALRVNDAVNATAGVRVASFAQCGLFMNCGSNNPITMPGLLPEPGRKTAFRMDYVGPRHFETMGVRILEGREFTVRDDQSSTKVAVVSESFARRFFPGKSPLGHRFGLGKSAAYDIEIVGVVNDVKLDSLKEARRETFFLPFLQRDSDLRVLEIRTAGDPLAVTSAVRESLRQIDRNLKVELTATMAQRVDASIARERLLATLSGFFGVLALLLVSIGLYGVISYNVTRRTHEIGIRISLGASSAAIHWMVLRDCLAMAAAGVAVGIPLCWWLSRMVSTLLFGVTPHDPTVIAAAALGLILIAVLAGYRPAHRAARVDPMVALRYE